MKEVIDLLRKHMPGVKIIHKSNTAVTGKIDPTTGKEVYDVDSRWVKGEFRSFQEFAKASKIANDNSHVKSILEKTHENAKFFDEYHSVLGDSLEEFFNFLVDNIHGWENKDFEYFVHSAPMPGFYENIKKTIISTGRLDLIEDIDRFMLEIKLCDPNYFDEGY